MNSCFRLSSAIWSKSVTLIWYLLQLDILEKRRLTIKVTSCCFDSSKYGGCANKLKHEHVSEQIFVLLITFQQTCFLLNYRYDDVHRGDCIHLLKVAAVIYNMMECISSEAGYAVYTVFPSKCWKKCDIADLRYQSLSDIGIHCLHVCCCKFCYIQYTFHFDIMFLFYLHYPWNVWAQ